MAIKRLKKEILLIGTVILASLLLGKYLIVPMTGLRAGVGVELICGLASLIFLAEAINIASGIIRNIKNKIRLNTAAPETIEDIRSIGIKNPVDFAFTMCNTLMCERTPVFCILESRLQPEMHSSTAVYKRTVMLFENYFGRKPIGWESGDWHTVLCLETAEVLKKDVNEITTGETLDQLSKEIQDRFFLKKIPAEEYEAM